MRIFFRASEEQINIHSSVISLNPPRLISDQEKHVVFPETLLSCPPRRTPDSLLTLCSANLRVNQSMNRRNFNDRSSCQNQAFITWSTRPFLAERVEGIATVGHRNLTRRDTGRPSHPQGLILSSSDGESPGNAGMPTMFLFEAKTFLAVHECGCSIYGVVASLVS